MKVSDLKPTEYSSFYGPYINKIPDETFLIEGLKKTQIDVVNFFKSIPKPKLEYRYAAGKWTIKEIFQHIIDNERVFMYRCLRIARRDKTPLPGYEQNDFIEPSQANNKTLQDLLEEYQAVRQCFIVLLKSLSDNDLKSIGIASDNPMSARATGFITLGHEIHHISVIKERYL